MWRSTVRVLLVNDYAAPQGGAEVQMLALREGLRQRGHEARLFASRAGGSEAWADDHCLGTTSRARSLLQLANPWAWLALRRVIRRFQPDVVHVRLYLTQLSPLILPLLRRVPSLHHVVWYRSICPTGTKMLPDGRLCRDPPGAVCLRNRCVPAQDWLPLLTQLRLVRRWGGHWRAIVANSEAVRRRLADAGIDGVEVIPNGVETRPARPPLADPPTAAFAGRLVPEKGAEVLVRAFAGVAATVPGARLLIVGDGPERPRLARLIERLGLGSSVSLLAHRDPAELESSLAPAWVQVVPSRWEDPSPNVALEAMMRGTAVVGTRRGGIPEMVRDGESGFLVPADDVAALSDAIASLLRDRRRAEAMGAAGRTVAIERFRMTLCLDRFSELYARLARERDPARRAAS